MKSILYFTRGIYQYAGKTLIFNFIGMLMIGLLQSVGILLLIPLLSVTGLVEMKGGDNPYLSWLFGWFQSFPLMQSLGVILAIYVLIICGQSLFERHQTIVDKRIQQGFLRKLREDTYSNLLRADWSFFLRNRNSDIVKMLTTEIAQVKKGMSLSLQFLSALIFAGVKITLAFILSPKITLVVLVSGCALLFISKYFTRKAKQFGQQNLELSKMYQAGVTDHLSGMKDIKSNTLEAVHVDWMEGLLRKVEHNAVAYTKMKTNSQLIYSLVSAVLLAVFIYVLVSLFHSQPAQLLLIIMIFSRLWPIVTRLQSNLESLATLVPSMEALEKLQAECKHARELEEGSFRETRPLRLQQGIECRNVCFRYENSGSYALKDISLYIPKGGMTAIVGPSGAGKSTLVDLLMGLNKPESGEVIIDGHTLDASRLLPLRRSISYVSQDPFLFHTSVRDNLLLMNAEASEKELWEVLEQASAADVVRGLKDGLDTVIGDRGIRLSGGERQRIVLARAILRKPEILILDEATSALDTATELKVKETLEGLKGSMTIIVIAHRLSTIRRADQVVVLEGGEMVQRGGYVELAKDSKRLFSRLLGNGAEMSSL